VAYGPISELTRQDLIDTLQALLLRCPQGISRPRVIPEQLRHDIVARVRTGESKEAVAAAYKLNTVTVNSVLAAAAS
jgi:hypothetical protein